LMSGAVVRGRWGAMGPSSGETAGGGGTKAGSERAPRVMVPMQCSTTRARTLARKGAMEVDGVFGSDGMCERRFSVKVLGGDGEGVTFKGRLRK
jgi:hypothetical protein